MRVQSMVHSKNVEPRNFERRSVVHGLLRDGAVPISNFLAFSSHRTAVARISSSRSAESFLASSCQRMAMASLATTRRHPAGAEFFDRKEASPVHPSGLGFVFAGLRVGGLMTPTSCGIEKACVFAKG